MTEREQDTAGDYGYDLVHEEVGPRPAAAPRAAQQAGSTSPPSRPAEASGDLEYDEAHDF